MKYTVVFDVDARADLAELYEYLLPEAGERIARDYIDRLTAFETFPERRMRREDISPGLRAVGYRNRATIAFRIKDNTVTIMRIFHGGREIRLTAEE
ncbi:type II toxin-antitoxin system RelE/ParE family toxin [Rhizobium rhizogenes]|jgi:plasmid stabilization system protein ParE|uniref:type II toxin-antitoxin system RelE/ParE family toxin n=1 Tax=Rhizobium rhizogenes TaxID=359 RepID=UPI0006481C09|nr:type II toxin-antitoxin system RelE/ParE family toxin [Rhizobium rhizogenes]